MNPGRVAVSVLGCVATAALTALVILPAANRLPTTSSSLAELRADEIDASAASLPANSAIAMATDAKSCKVPLAQVTLVKAPGATPGDTVRIRSGAYLSPPFKINEHPQRVAIPYPAPLDAGRGEIAILGEGSFYTISLSPPRFIPELNGVQPIAVTWPAKLSC